MPDAKPETAKTDTILAEQPMTPTQALRKLGWIQPVDLVILVLIMVVWVTLLYWKIFSEPSALQILSCCLVAFALTQLWVIILIYRCSHFVLMLTAHVNNMPDAAARMVIGYYSGRPPAPAPRK